MREFLRRGEPHISTINVRALIDDALILVGTEASGAAIRIEVDASPELPSIHADRVQLQQVILNLVQNSIDAIAASGRSDGHIRVAAVLADSPRRVEISVSDNGAGIAPDLAQRLFEPLTTSKRDGLGLGLSICATIVQSHHGRLWLQSGAPGATEFRFWLPLEQAIRFMTAVFVIDDQDSVRHALGEMLRVFGFTVEVFEFGRPVSADRRARARRLRGRRRAHARHGRN